MLPRRCPNCAASLVGRPIEQKGQCSWDDLMKLMVATGQMTASVPPLPGLRKCYFVTATCSCGKRLCDMPVMLTGGYLAWTEKVKRYEAADVLTEEMFGP